MLARCEHPRDRGRARAARPTPRWPPPPTRPAPRCVEDVGAADVGDHLGARAEGERVVTHLFACTRPGYVGWRWSVTVARAPAPEAGHRRRGRAGPRRGGHRRPRLGALPRAAPARRPLARRPAARSSDEDPRLVPTYSFGDDPLDADDKAQVRQVAQDLGLGRVRTLSRRGPRPRRAALVRRRRRPRVRRSPSPRPHHCHTCGFLVRIAGPLSETFGVCANGDANDDGRVVSVDHGCGAHSEVRLAKKHEPQPLPDHVFDTLNDRRGRHLSTQLGAAGLAGPAVGLPPCPRGGSAPACSSLLVGLLRAHLAAPPAVLQPEQPEPEAGQAGPQPPGAAGVLEPTVERQQRDEADQPAPACRPRRCGRRRRRGARRPRRCRCGCRSRAASAARRGGPPPRLDTDPRHVTSMCSTAAPSRGWVRHEHPDGDRARPASTATSRSPSGARRSAARSAAASSPSSRWPTSSCSTR